MRQGLTASKSRSCSSDEGIEGITRTSTWALKTLYIRRFRKCIYDMTFRDAPLEVDNCGIVYDLESFHKASRSSQGRWAAGRYARSSHCGGKVGSRHHYADERQLLVLRRVIRVVYLA